MEYEEERGMKREKATDDEEGNEKGGEGSLVKG